MIELNKVYNEDCLEGMKRVPDKSVDLIVIDPPYNIKKAEWDSWKTVGEYVEFMGSVFFECQRILKSHGSFYFFHNDFLQIVELQKWINENSTFIFRQFIVWNKKFDGCKNDGFLQGFNEVEGLRNYQKMAEYCLYYTLHDDIGMTTNDVTANNFPSLRLYFKELQQYTGRTKGEILGAIGQKADHCFRWASSQWDIPTVETYTDIVLTYRIDEWDGFKEYETLRREYDRCRYTFNNQRTHHSVWNYEVAKKQGHITPKPTDLVENILMYSSDEGDIVLDCFMGSGTTAIACMNTNRNFIGFELDETYHTLANERIAKHLLERQGD